MVGTIRDKVFNNETITLDGREFKSCIFIGCKLIYNGGEMPDFIGQCTFEKGTVFDIGGAAKRTITFLKFLNGTDCDLVDNLIDFMKTKHEGKHYQWFSPTSH